MANLFDLERENAHIIITLLGLKIKFKNPLIDRLKDCCCVTNLKMLLQKGTNFVHPIGVVIHPDVKIGNNCQIYQNVTLGSGKYGDDTKSYVPIVGDNVIFYANSVVIGGVTIGNNAVIGAGSVVLKSVPDNAVVCGNPAKVIRIKE